MKGLVCFLDGHRWIPISNLPLAGKVRARCERCRRVRFVHVHPGSA